MTTGQIELTDPERDLIPSVEVISHLKQVGKDLLQSGLLPRQVDSVEKVVVIALTGRELGIPMMQALRKVYVVHGNPTLAAELMLAIVNRTGQLEDLRIVDDGKACTVTMQRKGRTAHAETFSMADADRMQTKEEGKVIALSQKHNWRGMPAVMRKWRAVSAACRVVFPDAIGGMYTPEELDPDIEVTATGEPVRIQEVQVERVKPRRLSEGPVPLAGIPLPEAVPLQQPETVAATGQVLVPEGPRQPEVDADGIPAGSLQISPGSLDVLMRAIRAKGLTKAGVSAQLATFGGKRILEDLTADQGTAMSAWVGQQQKRGPAQADRS